MYCELVKLDEILKTDNNNYFETCISRKTTRIDHMARQDNDKMPPHKGKSVQGIVKASGWKLLTHPLLPLDFVPSLLRFYAFKEVKNMSS